MNEYKEIILNNLTKFVDKIIEEQNNNKKIEENKNTKEIEDIIRGVKSRARNSPTLFNIYGYYGFFSFLFYKSRSVNNLHNSYIFIKNVLNNNEEIQISKDTADKEGYSLYTTLLLYTLFSLNNKVSELDEIFKGNSVKLEKLLEKLKENKKFFEKAMKDFNLLVYMKQLLSLIPSKSDRNE